MAERESITAQGLEDLKAEIAELEGPRRRDMAARIKAARELGDLSENAEYHIAKEDQAHLETKILRLRERLRSAEVVDVASGGDAFAFGQTAEVRDEAAGETRTWTLVGPTEADLASGRISVESPIGSALRDAPVGQRVVFDPPRGEKAYVVEKLV
jgi:transcription elongation factor GreA